MDTPYRHYRYIDGSCQVKGRHVTDGGAAAGAIVASRMACVCYICCVYVYIHSWVSSCVHACGVRVTRRLAYMDTMR